MMSRSNQSPIRAGLFLLSLCSASLAMATSAIFAPAQAANPFATLRGSWGGSGTFRLTDGKKERISCNAYYTGSGSQLRMAIRCKSPGNKIEIRSRLSHNAGKLSGSWEERTYNAEGSASGSVSGSKLNLSISGSGMSASMRVSFTRSRQTISISVNGVALKAVRITLRRR